MSDTDRFTNMEEYKRARALAESTLEGIERGNFEGLADAQSNLAELDGLLDTVLDEMWDVEVDYR